MLRRPFLVILTAFALSVLVRLPQLGRPLSAHHEYCTAVALIVLQNWWTDGFATHHGAPIVSFTTPADRWSSTLADGPDMHDGLLYYFSHPPLAYDLPYALFVLTGTPPNPVGLTLLNMLFHLVTAWCLFLCLRRMSERGALLAALLYLFMPAPLWFHSNAYMSDMLVQGFWAMHVAVAMALFAGGPTLRNGALFTVTLFLTTWTSWPGVFAGATAALLALWKWRASRDARWGRVLLLAAVGVGAALALMAWRYTQAVGWDQLLAYYRARFAVRGSVGMEEGVGTHLARLVLNYRISYLPVLVVLAGLVVWRWRKRGTPVALPGLATFVVLTGLPVLLDHVFLLQYADHDFAALKAGLLLCGLAGLGLAMLPVRSAAGITVATCVAGVLYFVRLNPLPGHDHARYEQERTTGLMIARAVRPDEAVFTLGFTAEPQVQWYAQRTLVRIDGLPQARQHLQEIGIARGMVFRLRDGDLVYAPIAAE